jgi:hypothetical protein
LHHIWTHRLIPKLNFEEIIEKIKHTPFNWNTSVNWKLLLKHITYIFELDINIIRFSETLNCLNCKKSKKKCFFSCYVFQNTFIKLFSQCLNPINIVFFNKKYYLLIQNNIFPYLIHHPIQSNIVIDKYIISFYNVKDIILKKSQPYPFNINVFSSYEYISRQCTKKTYQNLLGKYTFSDNCKTINLFISPSLHNTFNLTLLSIPIADESNLKLNYVSLTTMTERRKKKLQEKNIESTVKLNQENCICDHPLTQRIFLPPNKSFKSLASPRFKKFLLYENLICFGLLDDNTKKILKICSEISFLSYDSESLNKNLYNHVLHEINDNFMDKFTKDGSPKMNYAIQQLYTIGLTEILPKEKIFLILNKYLPKMLLYKLKTYTTSNYKCLRSSIQWSMFEDKLKDLNLNDCAQELIELFESVSITENDTEIFHISNNHQSNNYIEPSIEKTCKMIYHFFTYIYQRNVLASLVKYILLKPLLNKFESYTLTESKGIFLSMKERLREIIFEFILTAFNGSNYDNHLICNNLILIQSKLNQKIKIFKKGTSISTIILNYIHNLQSISNITKSFQKKKKSSQIWPINLYIKDIRNLVASNVSLDKLGKLFNLPVSKLCFPYDKATSIKTLKNLSSLQPFDDNFWHDSFSNKIIPLNDRIKAQELFEDKGFLDLYEYSIFYLKQDCVLLHSIVITLFNTYLLDDINIYIRRNFSQSSLSYQQFFIVDPSKQIDYVLAPKKISNTFFNYFIKQAVTGGICTSFVQGTIDKNTIINEHFNYLDYPNLNAQSWPNFFNCQPWKKSFNEKPVGINTVDIRSLYPSAAIKKIPLNSPLFYSRFIKTDFDKISEKNFVSYDLQGFCQNTREHGSIDSDYFKLLNTPPRFYNEYYALKFYLNSLPKNIIIMRFQSNFTALGALYIGDYPIDGFLAYQDCKSKKIFLKIIQYNSVYYHGHKENCTIKNDEIYSQKSEYSKKIKNKILYNILNFKKYFNLNNIDIEYVEISDCDFFLHKIPRDKSFLFSYNKSYSYHTFLNKIYKKDLTGFLVVKNLEIAKNNQNPIFGFIIQKVMYNINNLSNLTQEQLQSFNTGARVIAINKSKSFMIISTEYFNWLKHTFGFEKTPDIYHALLFQTDNYLKPSIENKLLLRKKLKELIKDEKNIEKKQNYEIQSELIKLMLNSCYGFTLCNLTSSKFKMLNILRKFPYSLEVQKKLNSAIELNEKTYLIEKKKENIFPFETLLGHVGCSILFHSKLILIKRLYFLLKYLNPRYAQLLYMDTDSAHFSVKYKNFKDNVDPNLQKIFMRLFNKHFETGDKISGIWVEEGFFDSGEYIGEKCYTLFNENNKLSITHMKGLNKNFQNQFIKEKIDKNNFPCIAYNNFIKTSDFIIYKTYTTKNIFSNYVPIKRYFVSYTGSLPLKFD